MHYIKQSMLHWSHWLTKKNERRSFSLTSLAIPSANSRAAVLLRSTVKELLIAGYLQFSGSISRGDSNLSYLFPKLATSNFSQKYTYQECILIELYSSLLNTCYGHGQINRWNLWL